MKDTHPLRSLVCTASEVLAFTTVAVAAGLFIAALTDGRVRTLAMFLYFLSTLNCVVGGAVMDLKQIVVPQTERIRGSTIDVRWGFRRLWWASWWWRCL